MLCFFGFSNLKAQDTISTTYTYTLPAYISVTLIEVPFSTKYKILADIGNGESPKNINDFYGDFPKDVKTFGELLNLMEKRGFIFVNAWEGIIGSGPFVTSNIGKQPFYLFKKK